MPLENGPLRDSNLVYVSKKKIFMSKETAHEEDIDHRKSVIEHLFLRFNWIRIKTGINNLGEEDERYLWFHHLGILRLKKVELHLIISKLIIQPGQTVGFYELGGNQEVLAYSLSTT